MALVDGVEQVVVGVGVLAEDVFEGQAGLLEDTDREGAGRFLHIGRRQAALDGGGDEAGVDKVCKGVGHEGGVRKGCSGLLPFYCTEVAA